ncbi:MAG: HPr(Ser) kinase/phosphatase [Elusimicrobia bacterium]|nr:HPr(Ser) kinase/phosphatase [Elusimicrobiota bacterium]
MSLTVGELLTARGELLRIKVLAGRAGLNRAIRATEVNRPGLALLGHMERFRSERIQVIGRGEESVLRKLKAKQIEPVFARVLRYKNLPCFVITAGRVPPEMMLRMCDKAGVPVLQSSLDTAHFIGELHSHLEDHLAPSKYLHGVLVEVYGLGVLICGKSGAGKSECALELLKRGHFFIGDDLIRIKHLPGGVLIGEAARQEFGSYMEVRGLGIIDVKSLFGIGAVMDRTRVELVTTLEMWDGGRLSGNYERVGLSERTMTILGIGVSHVVFPVFPGRNLAILLEVASLNQRLKNKGVYSAREFEEKILEKTAVR